MSFWFSVALIIALLIMGGAFWAIASALGIFTEAVDRRTAAVDRLTAAVDRQVDKAIDTWINITRESSPEARRQEAIEADEARRKKAIQEDMLAEIRWLRGKSLQQWSDRITAIIEGKLEPTPTDKHTIAVVKELREEYEEFRESRGNPEPDYRAGWRSALDLNEEQLSALFGPPQET